MTNLTPREIVSELDRFIIGQNDLKDRLQLHFATGGEETN